MIDVRFVQRSNAPNPIDVTLRGIVIKNNELHFLNASSPIVIRLESDGIVTVCKLVHSQNAFIFITLTLDGIVIDDNELHP